MAFIEEIKQWAETLDVDEVTNTPQRLTISDNLWDKGWLRDVPVTTQHINQLFYLISGALLEVPSFENTFDKMFHVGYVHTVVGNNANPNTYFGRGTWVAEGQGRVLVGAGTGTDANGVSKPFAGGSSGGEYEHDITIAELPSHDHNVSATATTGEDTHSHTLTVPTVGGNQAGMDITDPSNEDSLTTETTSEDTHSHTVTVDVTESSVGSGSGMDVIQPYLTVYMWRRTA